MSNNCGDWQRVSRGRPCPICGKPDWCLYIGPDDAPDAAICQRVESSNRRGNGGWLHILRRDNPARPPLARTIEFREPPTGEQTVDFGQMAEEYRRTVKPEALEQLARTLSLSVESLERLGAGWSARHNAWTFPMHDASGKVTGIRLRLPDGRKLSVKGGKEGLFIPDGIDANDLLLISEGPTDAAALLDLGFSAIGRASCATGSKLIIDYIRHLNPPGVVVVADADPPGQRGAESLASVLLAYSQSVRIITPPLGIKDAREWKRQGGTHADVQAMIESAVVRKMVTV